MQFLLRYYQLIQRISENVLFPKGFLTLKQKNHELLLLLGILVLLSVFKQKEGRFSYVIYKKRLNNCSEKVLLHKGSIKSMERILMDVDNH